MNGFLLAAAVNILVIGVQPAVPADEAVNAAAYCVMDHYDTCAGSAGSSRLWTQPRPDPSAAGRTSQEAG